MVVSWERKKHQTYVLKTFLSQSFGFVTRNGNDSSRLCVYTENEGCPSLYQLRIWTNCESLLPQCTAPSVTHRISEDETNSRITTWFRWDRHFLVNYFEGI